MEDDILSATGYTEPSTFNELLSALGDDCPTERSEWASLFRTIEHLEKEGLLNVERVNGRVSNLQLTEAGAAQVKDKADAKRPLFN